MKITNVTTTLLTGPCTNDPSLTACRKRRSAAFIEIHTDTELVGIGETYAGYFFPEGVPPVVEFFKPILIGQNPDNIAQLWQRMFHCGNFWCRNGLGLIVLTAIEAALYDLRGKMFNVPVYELLGGRKHDKLLGYASGGPSNYPKSELAKKIDHYLSLGYIACKLGVGSFAIDEGFRIAGEAQAAADFESDKIAFVREHTGPDFRIMMDAHMGNSPDATWNINTARAVLNALAPYNLMFFEEPLHYTDPWGYAELRRTSPIPIAGGECLSGVQEWRTFIEKDAFDIGQPDASFAGGLAEFMKIAGMLEARGRKIATHTWGAAGGFMQNLHCGFACDNTAILEISPDFGPMHSKLMLPGSFRMKDGYVLPPENPGLGIVLTDKLKAEFPFVPGSGEFNSVPGKILVD